MFSDIGLISVLSFRTVSSSRRHGSSKESSSVGKKSGGGGHRSHRKENSDRVCPDQATRGDRASDVLSVCDSMDHGRLSM